MGADELYTRDLAHVHDEGFGLLARSAARHLVDRLGRAGVRGGLVVDLGCGSGIGAELLLGAGYDVLGIDASAEMLAIAARRAPGARFVEASVHDAEIPPCIAVTAIGEILNYAADLRAGRTAAARLFSRAHAALEPGGVLLFDVAGRGREPAGSRRTWHEREGWLMCLHATEAADRLIRRIVVFRRCGDGRYRRAEETHVLQLIDAGEIEDALTRAGFEAEVLERYGGELTFPAGLAGFVAVKAGR